MYHQHGNAGIQVRNVMFEEVPSEFTLYFSVSRPFANYYLLQIDKPPPPPLPLKGDLITKFITSGGIVEPHNVKEIISGVYDEINTLFSNEIEHCGTM